MGIVEFPNGMENKGALSMADQVMIAGKDGGTPTLATIQQFKNLLVAIATGQVIPDVARPGDVLGTPEGAAVIYAGPGTYTLPSGQVTLTANLNMFLWDGVDWDVMEVPVAVDLSGFIKSKDIAQKLITQNVEINDVQLSNDLNGEYLLSFEDKLDNIAWGITKAVDEYGRRYLKGLALDPSSVYTFKQLIIESLRLKSLTTVNSIISDDAEAEYIFFQDDVNGNIAWGITKAVDANGKRLLKGIAFELPQDLQARTLSVDKVNAKSLSTSQSTVEDDAEADYILFQEDKSGNIAWGITKAVDSNGKRILKGVVTEGTSVVNLKISTLSGHDIYTTCNDITSWNDKLRGFSLNVYVERLLVLTSKVYVNFESTKSLYKTLASRRYFHPEPQNGASAMQSNYRQNVRIEIVSDKIVGAGVESTDISFSHISTLASLGATKLLKILKMGDSNVNGGESDKNRPYAGSPRRSWEWHKFYLELDKDDNSGNGFNSVFIGSRTVSSFDIIKSTTRNVRAAAEGYSGWAARDLLSAKTFADGNRFYDPDKAGTIKFSLRKYLSRYRTMSDDGVRLSDTDPAKGSEVTDTTLFDVCTPNVIVIQLGFNDSASTYVADMRLLIATIKDEFPQMIIGLAFVGSAGSYYPELWPGWEAASKDISFLEPMDISHGFGYSKRLNDKMNSLYTTARSLEDKANGIYFLAHNLIQPTANSVPYREQSEPYGLVSKQPVGESSFGYHPNNSAHAIWGYHEYSWTRYLCAQNLI